MSSLSVELLQSTATGVLGFGVGYVHARLRRRRRSPKVDPTTLAACDACGGTWGKWSATDVDDQQTRACTECGRAQRRYVPTK